MVNHRLRVVFFGTPRFAIPTLDALLRSTHTVVAAVTQPDRPRGRGHRVSDAPVKARAVELSVPVFQPDRLRDPDFSTALRSFDPDLGVVAAYGRILPDAVLALPRFGMVNVHASLLPRYRGAAPVHRAILAGERETGVTIMRVVKELDAGPMLASTRCDIDPDATSEEVEAELARTGADLLVEIVDRLAQEEIRGVPQDDGLATYAPRLTREDGSIPWSDTARQIHDRVRGLYPWPHAFSFLEGHRVILLRTRVEANDGPGPVAPGTIVTASGSDLAVRTGSGLIHITELQPEGRRPMTAREFMAGRAVQPGARFTSG
jgi:methionyl-tRNA formyltransferase